MKFLLNFKNDGPRLSHPRPDPPVDMALLKPKLINEFENLTNSKLSFFGYILIFKEKILVLMKKQDCFKFLNKTSTDF